MANFNEDLFGCFSDLKLCLLACCVPGGVCCLQAEAVYKAYGQSRFVPYLFPFCLACIGGAVNRGKIRERYSLEGSFIVDCLLWWIVPVCASLQEYKEVKSR